MFGTLVIIVDKNVVLEGVEEGWQSRLLSFTLFKTES